MKNTDIKTFTAAANSGVKPLLKLKGVGVQRGFVADRNASNNVVDIDAASRFFGLQAFQQPSLLPLIALFDFQAAFPSVSQVFLMLALERM